jgi:hypothetical protein
MGMQMMANSNAFACILLRKSLYFFFQHLFNIDNDVTDVI